MADRLTTHINRPGMLTRKRDIVQLAGYFETNGAAAPTVIKCPGVTSITHAATGKLTVTLDDSYKDVSVILTLQKVAGATLDVRVDASTFVAGTGSAGNSFIVQFSTSSTGAPAAPPASTPGLAGTRVHMLITCARKSDFGTVTD